MSAEARQVIAVPAAGGLAGMHPAYFALVMATGIVAIACHLFDLRLAAKVLFAFDVLSYATLWLLLVTRASSRI